MVVIGCERVCQIVVIISRPCRIPSFRTFLVAEIPDQWVIVVDPSIKDSNGRGDVSIELHASIKIFCPLLLFFKELEILINEKRISRAVGMKKTNLNRLKGKIEIKMDNSLELDKIIVNSVEYNRQDLLKNLL